jgi:hypothetical protein
MYLEYQIALKIEPLYLIDDDDDDGFILSLEENTIA